jgi:hypothetical protein
LLTRPAWLAPRSERFRQLVSRQVPGQVEDASADQAGGRALKAHHAADAGVDHDQQRELRPVRAQPEAHLRAGPGVRGAHLLVSSGMPLNLLRGGQRSDGQGMTVGAGRRIGSGPQDRERAGRSVSWQA